MKSCKVCWLILCMWFFLRAFKVYCFLLNKLIWLKLGYHSVGMSFFFSLFDITLLIELLGLPKSIFKYEISSVTSSWELWRTVHSYMNWDPYYLNLPKTPSYTKREYNSSSNPTVLDSDFVITAPGTVLDLRQSYRSFISSAAGEQWPRKSSILSLCVGNRICLINPNRLAWSRLGT